MVFWKSTLPSLSIHDNYLSYSLYKGFLSVVNYENFVNFSALASSEPPDSNFSHSEKMLFCITSCILIASKSLFFTPLDAPYYPKIKLWKLSLFEPVKNLPKRFRYKHYWLKTMVGSWFLRENHRKVTTFEENLWSIDFLAVAVWFCNFVKIWNISFQER